MEVMGFGNWSGRLPNIIRQFYLFGRNGRQWLVII